MVLKRGNPIFAGTLLSAALCFSGCLWVDEEIPAVAQVDPWDHAPHRVMPRPIENLVGLEIASSGEIESFLEGRKFRLAMLYPKFNVAGTRRWNQALFVLEKGPPGMPPVIIGFPGSTGVPNLSFTGRGLEVMEACRISPDGRWVAVEVAGWGFSQPPMLWLQGLESGAHWRVPVFSSRNRTYGHAGRSPFWYQAEGRMGLAYTAPTKGRVTEFYWGYGHSIGEVRWVEPLSDSTLTRPLAARPGGTHIPLDIDGISRDGRWALIRGNDHMNYFLAVGEIDDSIAQDPVRTLRAREVGRASLNPFDPASTQHTDFFATTPFEVVDETRRLDTVLSPRTLDGRLMTAAHPDRDDNFWICDRDRRIILSHRVGEGKGLPRWSNHPNFVVYSDAKGDVYLVKLAAEAADILAHTGTATRRAAGVLKLMSMVPDYYTNLPSDLGLWIDG